MKRVLFSVLGTVLGLVALLNFKSHSQSAVAGALPSAGLSGSSPTTSPSPSTTAASGPPDTASTSEAPSSATPAATSTASSAAKTYDGSAVQTRYGTVQVEITVADSKITNVSFLQLTSFDGRSAEINDQAGPILLQETLSAQSAAIDTVSGATFTSEGYLQSLQSALDQAGLR